MLKTLKWLLTLIVAVVLVVPAVFLSDALEPQPRVHDVRPSEAADLSATRALLQRYRVKLNSAETSDFAISEAELDSLVRVATGRLPRIASQARLREGRAELAASLEMPANFLGKFLNVGIDVLPSDTGLVLGDARVGGWSLPGAWILRAAETVLRLSLDADTAGLVMTSFRSVAVTPRGALVRLRPVPQLAAKLKDRIGTAVSIADPDRVRVYYQALADAAGGAPPRGSLAPYLRQTFALARERTVAGDEVAETKAAILALTMYFAEGRFERLVGPVRTGALGEHRPRTGKITLLGRRDLTQHYLISASLAIAAGSGVAWAIGELKEIQDTDARGSGFSFTDLAADRAGVRLAERAMAGAGSARALQAVLAGRVDESLFFPNIDGLPEFLSQAAFAQRFGAIDSEPYRRLVADIDRRIAACAAYGAG